MTYEHEHEQSEMDGGDGGDGGVEILVEVIEVIEVVQELEPLVQANVHLYPEAQESVFPCGDYNGKISHTIQLLPYIADKSSIRYVLKTVSLVVYEMSSRLFALEL